MYEPPTARRFRLNPFKKKEKSDQRGNGILMSLFFPWPCWLKIHLILPLIWVNCYEELFGNLNLSRSLWYVQQMRETKRANVCAGKLRMFVTISRFKIFGNKFNETCKCFSYGTVMPPTPCKCSAVELVTLKTTFILKIDPHRRTICEIKST